MSTFLFAAHPSAGHLNPLLAVARRLRERGHQVVFVCSAATRAAAAVAAEGFRLERLRPALGTLGLLLLPWTSGFLETFAAATLFTRGLRHYARGVGGLLDALSGAVVVADFTFPGAFLAAESRGVPWAAIYHAGLSFPGPGVPPFGSGLPIGAAPGRLLRAAADHLERSIAGDLAAACRRFGLPASGKSMLSRPASPWLNLVLTAEACEAARDPLPPSAHFVGPCIDRGRPQPPFPFERLRDDRAKVLVSMGTVFNSRPALFRRLLQAFPDGAPQLVVSAGASYPRLRGAPLPDGTILVETAPQLELLQRVDAFVSHGGNNSVNEALAAGVPLLVIPVGGEQGDNASRVVHLGAGLRADRRRADRDELREKVSRLLAEASFRRRARELAQALQATDGIASSAELLERLAATRAPVLRRPGQPLTVERRPPAPAVTLGVDATQEPPP